jgi:RNA polymerase sigma factor (sigma-70 family)
MYLFRKKYYRTRSDEQLVELLRKGDRKNCISELYLRYSHLVFGVGLKYLKNKMDAEDATAELFIHLEDKILRGEIHSFKPWLYSVTRNECLMKLRKKKPAEQEISDLQQNDNEESDYISEDDLYTLMERSITLLKHDQQVCLKLFFFSKKSYEQIGQQLSMSVKQVKSHIQNGKRKLRILMEESEEYKRTKL